MANYLVFRHRNVLLGGVAVAAMLSGGAGPAFAQTSAAPRSDQPEIPTIVVTAQRRSENIQNVPVSVQAVTSKEIQALGIKQTEDLGQITPNLTIASPEGSGNQPLITIRGIGLNDFDSNNAGPNGIYVDDVYISAPSAQSFAIFDLDQVQVLKGPQGTLYGRNTSGGALVFTTKKPTDVFSSDFHLEYGNFNTVNVSGGVGGPITSNLDGRISAVYNYSDGYMHNEFYGDQVSGANNGAVRLQLLYKPLDKLKIAFNSTVGYVNQDPTEYGHVGIYAPGTQGGAAPTVCSPAQAATGACVDLFGYKAPAGFHDGSYNQTSHLKAFNIIESLRVDYNVGGIDLASISAYEHNWKYYPEETDSSPNNLLSATYGVHSNTWTQEFRASQSTKQFNWVAGVYYLYEDLRQNQPLTILFDGDKFGGFGIPAGPGAFDGIAQKSFDYSDQTTNSAAIYGQGDYTIGKLTLTLGGRYTYERKTFNYTGSTQFQDGGLGNYGPLTDLITADEKQTASNITWRAAAAYHLTRDIMGYASAATGFKSGDFNGSFLSNDPEQAALQLTPVKPEHVTSYEIGAKTTLFDRRVVFNAALFYNNYTNEQIFAAVPQLLETEAGPIESTTQILTNAAKAHTQGVEFEFTATPIRGLTINLDPAFLEAKIDQAGLPEVTGSLPLDGKQLANAPRFSFSGMIDYKLEIMNDDDIDFRWNSNYRSHEFFDSTNDPYIQQNSYWIHNLNVSYESHQGWEAGIYVRNLTATKYNITSTDLSSPFGFIEPVVGMPRTYGVELTAHF
jgi:iron complex outermembrane receptor protein